ncbi:MAG: DUF262 domain-containing protein [Myxococcota bacterium]
MKLQASDPDIETIFRRIEREELDLQPDFQRGEVWTKKKQRRLIDSILRGWHIPPIHVVENPELQKGEVLDGQQRLAAIRDFIRGSFSVDGTIEPESEKIRELDKCSYEALPKPVRRAFDGFTIRMFTLHDYTSDEPAELFFRLNQNSSLTPPEQRNAFFGDARNQVRRLAAGLAERGIDDSLLGFSNSRMAHDDVVARTLYTLEIQTLRKKVTASALSARYRDGTHFNSNATERMSNALRDFGTLSHIPDADRHEIKFNKATVYSWWIFLSRTGPSPRIGNFIKTVEAARARVKSGKRLELPTLTHTLGEDSIRLLLSMFNDRASSRVADTASVVSRDMVLWVLYGEWVQQNPLEGSLSEEDRRILSETVELVEKAQNNVDLAAWMDASGWGTEV